MKLEPNLLELSFEEFDKEMDKVRLLKSQGKEEEALALNLKITPILHLTANRLKHEMGIEALIAEGYNLSGAVKHYGKDWLTA